jgi:hypothetical protein
MHHERVSPPPSSGSTASPSNGRGSQQAEVHQLARAAAAARGHDGARAMIAMRSRKSGAHMRSASPAVRAPRTSTRAASGE